MIARAPGNTLVIEVDGAVEADALVRYVNDDQATGRDAVPTAAAAAD